MPEELKSYLDWNALLTPEQVYADTIGIGYLLLSPLKVVYWLESRASEKGRNTIVRQEGEKVVEITPKTFNVRSRVHEYGGRPYFVGKNFVYFVNFMDQRIYKQNVEKYDDIIPLTPDKNKDGSIGKYMNLFATSDETKLFFIYEQEFQDHSTPKNTIAWLDLTTDSIQEPKILVEGNDFYSEFTLSDDGLSCCWLTWNLPYMPWDYTELWIAKVTPNGLDDPKKIAGGNGESIVSPIIKNNEIYFAMDFPNKSEDDYQNYWNIYRYNKKLEKIFPVTKEFVEFGHPLWVSGIHNFSFLSENELICLYRKNGKSNLALLQLDQLKLTKLPLPYTVINSLLIKDNLVYIQGASSNLPQLLTSFEFLNQTLTNEKIILKSLPDQFLLPSSQISTGQLFAYPTKDGEKAYAYLYLPKNTNYELENKNERPPLLVIVHGGPTGNSDTFYSNYLQYWTSEGFAIMDIEHRGSTGFGRKYRDKLLGQWGIIEISDIEDAIKYLLAKHIISNKVAITGGSAGGYTVQRSLTAKPDLFQVGASHFGIGNLETLVQLTHKFESKYINRIVGDDPQQLKDRSPINNLDNLKSPMIIFQGSDDKIVPPDVSREMAEILKEKGIKSEYIEYPGEGHGFRQLENKVDALKKESLFFKEVLKS